MQLFTTGFLQVYFVAINTYFIANSMYIGVGIASFAISFIWTLNVRKVAFGRQSDRIIYATGAMLGSVLGLFSGELINIYF